MIRWTEKELPIKCKNCDMPESYKKNAYGRCGYCYEEKRKGVIMDTRVFFDIEKFDSDHLSILHYANNDYKIVYVYGKITITFHSREDLIGFVKKLEEEIRLKIERETDKEIEMFRATDDYKAEVFGEDDGEY